MRNFFILLSIISTTSLNAKISKRIGIKYKTYFGQCPSRVVGNLTMKLVKTFEQTHSLKEIKEKIVRERLDEKHFLSSYDVKYNPLKNFLTFSFDCPEPLMKVQIYKSNGIEHYTAILVDNGKLFDPTYEYILETEKKLTHKLPSLALPVGEIDKSIQMKITNMVKEMRVEFRKKISEIILDENKKLTIILSERGRPISAFFGATEWELKSKKLKKIINYLSKKRKTPSIINLTNDKKVVVKFSTRT